MDSKTYVIDLDDEVVAYLKVKNIINISDYTILLLQNERDRSNFIQ